PALVIPGMNAETIAVAVGYGRNDALGKTSAGVGKNVFPLASFNGTTVDYFAANASLAKSAAAPFRIAQTQKHNSYEGRLEVVRETNLAKFKKEPDLLPEYRKELQEDYYKTSDPEFRSNATLYPQYDQPGIKWGMTIDMNSCVSCGACVVACH